MLAELTPLADHFWPEQFGGEPSTWARAAVKLEATPAPGEPCAETTILLTASGRDVTPRRIELHAPP